MCPVPLPRADRVQLQQLRADREEDAHDAALLVYLTLYQSTMKHLASLLMLSSLGPGSQRCATGHSAASVTEQPVVRKPAGHGCKHVRLHVIS